MDRLDRFSIWAIVILLISSSALVSYHMGEAIPGKEAPQRVSVTGNAGINAELGNKVRVIRNLIEANNLGKAETFARELILQYPYEGEPRMLTGDIFIRKQEAVKAMFEYKEAIELNPDYLDKKTPFFQGKKLKAVVREALEEIEKKIKLKPDDESIKRDRKIIYYLQRRIAGSCG
ncbi:MAG: hypothetical protein HZA11_01005 [Nitrospirae bacterium]|nr:hypothetical protein [Nitrospirota bacterium]